MRLQWLVLAIITDPLIICDICSNRVVKYIIALCTQEDLIWSEKLRSGYAE